MRQKNYENYEFMLDTKGKNILEIGAKNLDLYNMLGEDNSYYILTTDSDLYLQAQGEDVANVTFGKYSYLETVYKSEQFDYIIFNDSLSFIGSDRRVLVNNNTDDLAGAKAVLYALETAYKLLHKGGGTLIVDDGLAVSNPDDLVSLVLNEEDYTKFIDFIESRGGKEKYKTVDYKGDMLIMAENHTVMTFLAVNSGYVNPVEFQDKDFGYGVYTRNQFEVILENIGFMMHQGGTYTSTTVLEEALRLEYVNLTRETFDVPRTNLIFIGYKE